MDVAIFFQVIVNGILLGGLYMTVSVGLNLVYGVMRIVNYAQGELLMLGMYLSYWIFVLTGLNPYISIPVVCAILFAMSLVLHKYAVEPLLKLPYECQVITFIGLIYIFQNAALLLWSPNYRSVIIGFASESINLLSISIPVGRLIATLASITAAFFLYIILKKTTIGLFIRATSQDPIAASMMGIDIKKIRLLTFALSSAMMGIGAGIMLPLYYVYPFMGNFYTIIALIIITLGGLGNFIGTILGSFVIGITEAMVGTYISAEIGLAVAFIIFISILLIRPSGIMGE